MRQMTLMILLLSITALGQASLFQPLVAQQQHTPQKSYTAERYDVALQVQRDGTLRMHETVVFHFSGGPFSFVSREVPDAKTDGITFISASINGQTMKQGDQAGEIEIQNTSPLQVKWHMFQPLTDQTATFELTYLVRGVIQKEAQADLLYWHPLPTDHTYSISSSTITVTYPQSAVLREAPRDVDGFLHVIKSDSSITVFQGQNLGANASPEILLRFRPGSVITSAPDWQVKNERAAQSFAPSLWSSLGLLILGLVSLLGFYSRIRRPKGMYQGERTQEPLNNLPPALAGTLVTGGTGKDQVLGTIFDLAQRGVIAIVNPSEHDYALTQTEYTGDLRPHEREVLRLLFNQDVQASVPVKSLNERYSRDSKYFTTCVRDELLELGLYDRERVQTAKRLRNLSILLFVLTFVVFLLGIVLGAFFGLWPLLLLSVALLCISIGAVVISSIYSPVSVSGLQERARLREFSQYLKNIAHERVSEPTPQTFEQYLSYAASFGLFEQWVAYFERRGSASIPHWFTAENSHAAFFPMMHSVYVNINGTSSSSGSGVSGAGGSFGGSAAGGGSSSAG